MVPPGERRRSCEGHHRPAPRRPPGGPPSTHPRTAPAALGSAAPCGRSSPSPPSPRSRSSGAPAHASGKTSRRRRLRRHRQRHHLQPRRRQETSSSRTSPYRPHRRPRRATTASTSTSPTLGVYDYTLTGAPDTQRMVTEAHGRLRLEGADAHRRPARRTHHHELELKDDTLVIALQHRRRQVQDPGEGRRPGRHLPDGARVRRPRRIRAHPRRRALLLRQPVHRQDQLRQRRRRRDLRAADSTRCCSARTAPRSRRRRSRPAPSRSGSSPRAAASAACSARTPSS